MAQTLKNRRITCITAKAFIQQTRLFYKITNGLVPAVNDDEYLTPLDNKRRIKPTQYTRYMCKEILTLSNPEIIQSVL